MNPETVDSQISFRQFPKPSGWKCYLFGNRPGGTGIIWEPNKGYVPNIFVRFFMKVCLDCKWEKPSEQTNEA